MLNIVCFFHYFYFYYYSIFLLPSPMSNIYLYAELLFNIRQITVFAILPSNCNAKTKVWLDHDLRTLRLSHEDEESIIELPCSVANNANLKLPSVAVSELSFRLVVGDTAILPAQSKQATDCNDPWQVSRLSPETQVGCGSCGTLMVTNVNVWKHLPSASWAEMMDFWHCHKPSAIDGHDDYAGSSKGYAAANALDPTTGTGLVCVSHLLVLAMDCTGIKVGLSVFLPLRTRSNLHERATRRRRASEFSVLWQRRRYNCPREIVNSTVNQCLTTLYVHDERWVISFLTADALSRDAF